MLSKQIKSGKTYVGKNGQRRTVRHIHSMSGKICVGVFDHRKQQTWGGIPLGDFAKWAQKEDK